MFTGQKQQDIAQKITKKDPATAGINPMVHFTAINSAPMQVKSSLMRVASAIRNIKMMRVIPVTAGNFTSFTALWASAIRFIFLT